MKTYKIERFAEGTLNKWMPLFPFVSMRQSYAYGAWDMLKAHYNQSAIHRLVCDDKVIDTCGKQQVQVN